MARRGDTSKPKLNARQRFQQKQQHNRIVAELEQMYASGMTADQVRATRNKQVTIADTDNLSTIAAANGTTEADILGANPNMTTPKTGMVINVPGSEAWRAQNVGGVGLPSAGPLGVAPGGLSTYQDPRTSAGRGVNANRPGQFALPGLQSGLQSTPFSQSSQRQYGPPAPTTPRPGAWNPNAFATPLEQYTNPNYQPPVATPVTNQPPTPGLPRVRQFAPRENHVTLLDSITRQVGMQGAVPTELQMKLLINSGRVKPTGQNNFGTGGGNYRQFGGGGRGKGGANRATGGGYQSEPRLPAFSTGQGGFALVNWRI